MTKATMRIHCTKKLLTKLPVDENGLLTSLPVRPVRAPSADHRAPGALGDWHANLLTLQRRNCLLFVHDQTRFPVFIPALTKADFVQLNERFDDALLNTLLKCGADHAHIEAASAHLQTLCFDNVCDRSVQGTMNQMAQDMDAYLYYDQINVAEITGYRLGAQLAHRPCSVKGQRDCIWPDKAFLTLLESLPPPTGVAGPGLSGQPLPANVVDLAVYLKR